MSQRPCRATRALLQALHPQHQRFLRWTALPPRMGRTWRGEHLGQSPGATMTSRKALNLGPWRYLDDRRGSNSLKLPADHLVTHGVVVGMTGSGKTGLVTVLI